MSDTTPAAFHHIVVSGMGIVSSIGHNVADFASSLKSGGNGAVLLEPFDPPLPVSIGYRIRNFSFVNALSSSASLPEETINNAKRCARGSTPFMQCCVAAALEAWEHARMNDGKIPSTRIGIVIAGSNLSQNFHYETQRKFQSAPEYLNPRYALQYMDTDFLGTLSEILNIHGEGFSAGGASASGNVAILKGAQLIQLGIVDACLIVAPPASLSPVEFQGFYNIGAMGGRRFAHEPDRACRPFDRDHEGFIYGEGCACLLLESKRSAAVRRITPVAEMLGGALVLDGNRLSDPSVDAEARAMELALSRSGITAREIEYVNAHGSSSPLGDETEVKALRKVFGDLLPQIWVNSTKGMTGHCLSSAGVVEAIATIVQMDDSFIHANINLEDPIDDQCRFSGSHAVEAAVGTAISNSFGFGGINTSIVFRKGES